MANPLQVEFHSSAGEALANGNLLATLRELKNKWYPTGITLVLCKFVLETFIFLKGLFAYTLTEKWSMGKKKQKEKLTLSSVLF